MRYVLAGSGGRGTNMFARPVVERFSDRAELVALFDHNTHRMKVACQALGRELPTFTHFDRMLGELQPDGVIVATVDRTHSEFIVKALNKDKLVICEKPVCVSDSQCRDILGAADASKGKVIVTHNARYGAAACAIKSAILEGKVGEVLRLHFEEHLDRVHGADYFRRWHRRKENSGGLLVHKACHQFDLLNWFADARPRTVYARGALRVYGKNGPFRSARCRGCPHADKCDYYVDLFKVDRYRKLYLEAEKEDGYIRDGCVFAEEIDIEDQVSAVVEYDNGVLMSYDLCAYSPYEGSRIVVDGIQGRLEYNSVHSTGWLKGSERFRGGPLKPGESLSLLSSDGKAELIEIHRVKGSHGGADTLILQDLFGEKGEDPLNRQASLMDGIQAVLIGAGANISMETGEPVEIQALLG